MTHNTWYGYGYMLGIIIGKIMEIEQTMWSKQIQMQGAFLCLVFSTGHLVEARGVYQDKDPTGHNKTSGQA